MPETYIQNTTLILGFNPVKILENASIHLADSHIKAIHTDPHSSPTGVRVIDGRGKLTMPGFINAHHHFYSAFARGIGGLAVSRNFEEVLNHLWWKLDRNLTEEACYYSALTGCIESIKSGTTTVMDHHSAPYAMDLSHLAKATEEAGIRACLCYEVSDRDGADLTQKGIESNIAFHETLVKQPSHLLRALFGLHASFTVNDATLEKTAEIIENLNTGIHIHLAEAILDQEKCKNEHGCRVVERLDRMGLLNNKAIVAHGVHLESSELHILRERGCSLVHNAQSNMNNAVGAANLSEWENQGIAYGLGTDAMTTQMLEELRCAIWLQKHHAGDPSVGFEGPVKALLSGNPRLAKKLWGLTFDTLSEGSPADLIMVDYLPITPLSEDNFVGHLVFGIHKAPVDTTIVAGKILMENKILSGLDERAIARTSRNLAQRLWDKML